MGRFWNHVMVLGLAALALLFGSGCSLDPLTYVVGYFPDGKWDVRYEVRCESDTQTLQLYRLAVVDDAASFEARTQEGPIDSPINGKPCSVSTELQKRPFTESEPIYHILVPSVPQSTPASRAAAAPAAASPGNLTNSFPSLVPLLFPPLFPDSDSGKATHPCPPSLGTYLVNHTEGTVTSFGLCPMHVLREISVQSNPLQLAITPDGATVLVTSYDSAVTFIDTATDKVTFTLPTPGYNPSGIAISPDGTRAYVTHYLDANPSLLVIDVPNHKLLSTIALPSAYPRVVVITPDGAQAWVNYYGSSYITIVDLLSASVSTTLNFGAPIATGMAFNPAGSKAFVAADPNLVMVIDTATLSILARVAVGPSPVDVVADPNGHAIYVNSGTQDGTWIVDPVKNNLLAAPANPTPGGSMGLTVF